MGNPEYPRFNNGILTATSRTCIAEVLQAILKRDRARDGAVLVIKRDLRHAPHIVSMLFRSFCDTQVLLLNKTDSSHMPYDGRHTVGANSTELVLQVQYRISERTALILIHIIRLWLSRDIIWTFFSLNPDFPSIC